MNLGLNFGCIISCWSGCFRGCSFYLESEGKNGIYVSRKCENTIREFRVRVGIIRIRGFCDFGFIYVLGVVFFRDF